MRILLQSSRKPSLAVGENRHARRTIYDSGVGVVDPVRIAGVGAGKECLSEQILLTLGIECSAGEWKTWIEVTDVAVHIVVARQQLITQSVAQGQILGDFPLILTEKAIVCGFAVIVLGDDVVEGLIRKAGEEVGEVNPGE